jgi:NDP-sugar pyrophosphorylase family protein
MAKAIVKNAKTSGEKPDAIILAAGMMGRKTLYPKALVEFEGKSIIEHQINWLSSHVNKIVIACHKDEYEPIHNYLGNMKNVEYSLEPVLLGTSGAVIKALEKTKASKILICNVDDVTDIDLKALIGFGTDTIAVANPRLNYGIIKIDGFEVEEFREKPIMPDLWVSCGVYLLDRKTMQEFSSKGSLERDVFPGLNLKAFKHFGLFKTFGPC